MQKKLRILPNMELIFRVFQLHFKIPDAHLSDIQDSPNGKPAGSWWVLMEAAF